MRSPNPPRRYVTNPELYRAICAQSPASIPVFSQSWWLDAVCHSWDAAVTLKGDEITGIWPYVKEEKYAVSLRRTPRLTPYLGPHVFYPPDIKAARRDSHEHDVIAELLSQLPAADVWHLALEPGLKQAGLFRNYGLKMEVRQTFLIDLREEEEAIFQRFRESLPRNIRAAGKELSIASEPESIGELYAFVQATLSRKHVRQPYSLDDAQRLLQACVDNGSGTIWTARNATGGLEAALWNVWDARRSYYLLGAKNPAAEGYRATSLLLWHCIREAKQRGAEYFDLEGSMDPGVERFFRSFGGRRELYMVLRKDGSLLWRLARVLR